MTHTNYTVDENDAITLVMADGNEQVMYEPSRYLYELRKRERSNSWPKNIMKPLAVQNALMLHYLLIGLLYILVIILFITRRG